MSSTSTSPPTAVFEASPEAPVDGTDAAPPEGCPLCGSPLHPDQEWCLRCGAAARTRLAMSSNWKGPIVALAIVAVLSLGVIAASLVALAGGFGTAAKTTTTTVTAAAAPVTPTATATTAAPKPAAVTGYPGTASGLLATKPIVKPPAGPPPPKLVITDLRTGTGTEAQDGDMLTVNYVGVLFHGGAEFDSSWKRHSRFTFTFGVGKVIAGWDEGLRGMRVGGRRELVVPAVQAYGAKGLATVPPIPPNEALVFVVDLLGVSKPAAQKPPAQASTPAAKTSPGAHHNLSAQEELKVVERIEHASKNPAQKKRDLEIEEGLRKRK